MVHICWSPYRAFADLLKYMLQDGLTDEKIPLVKRFGGSASVITLKPATCGQFKTGHFAWPET